MAPGGVLSPEPLASAPAPANTEAGSTNRDPATEKAGVYSVFSPATRTYLTYHLGLIMLISTLTSTIYSPLIPMLGTSFSVSIQAINTTVTVYAICQAISPALFSSLADAFGRRPVLLAIIALYACASLGLALNRGSFAALLALRALQSVGGSATVPIAYGVVADVADVPLRGAMLGPMLATCNAICAAGPVVGGALALGTGGYAWVFIALLIVALALLVSVGLALPETGRNVVDDGSRPARGVWRTWWSFISPRERARREDVGHVAQEAPEINGVSSWHPMDALVPLRIILYPDAAAVLWMVASSYSVYYTFQAAVPVIFAEIYGYNELEIGLALLPVFAGLTIGGIVAGKLIDRNYARVARRCDANLDREKREDGGEFPLEMARYRRCMPFILLEVALIAGYGWAVQYHVHPSVPLVLHFFICGTSTILTHTSNALLVDIFPGMSSTAYASGQVVRCGLSAASVAVLQPIIDAVGRGWYFTIFALFVGVTGVVSVIISRLKGMQWRRKRQMVACTRKPVGQQLLSESGQEPPAGTPSESNHMAPKT
ncbi:major facilitator superfamily domain-containing protein [Phialemonium atrogriseum]|uniref:Major facilitator superfamily domain-containing protein n=1 Tax=Phialemonium atrogriseum TaxID=1093897 RepID=A0AAJ0BTL3_9PEZI|nr:major facilitator superfamily domain-containing protein [Phialemonium atrogriseum]KAK1764259.1 major facilitator superfamily domain-containing protein [Phialemonium atrogriseum]